MRRLLLYNYGKYMITYLYGPDSLRRNTKLAELLHRLEEGEISERMDADVEENPDAWRSVKDFCRQQSIFGGLKIATVREGGSLAEKEWITFLKEEMKDPSVNLFILDRGKPLKALNFLLEKPSLSYEFEELAGRSLSLFAVQEAEKRGFAFSPDALSFFLSYLAGKKEGRSWIAVGEIEKAGFLGITTVSLEDLNSISSFPDFDEVWALSRRIVGSERWMEKIVFLERLFLEGADSGHVFNSLALQATGKEIARLAAYDISVKSGKLDFPEALLDFVLS